MSTNFKHFQEQRYETLPCFRFCLDTFRGEYTIFLLQKLTAFSVAFWPSLRGPLPLPRRHAAGSCGAPTDSYGSTSGEVDPPNSRAASKRRTLQLRACRFEWCQLQIAGGRPDAAFAAAEAGATATATAEVQASAGGGGTIDDAATMSSNDRCEIVSSAVGLRVRPSTLHPARSCPCRRPPSCRQSGSVVCRHMQSAFMRRNIAYISCINYFHVYSPQNQIATRGTCFVVLMADAVHMLLQTFYVSLRLHVKVSYRLHTQLYSPITAEILVLK